MFKSVFNTVASLQKKGEILYFVLVIVLISCASGSPKSSIDSFILKHNNTSFDELKNCTISYQGIDSRSGKLTYFIGKFNTRCSPYVLRVDKGNIQNIEIDNKLVIKSCRTDYFSTRELQDIFFEYSKYDISVLQVDSLGNVYFNPNSIDPPILLRKVSNTSPLNLNQYRLYKGNWYLRKTYFK